MSTEPSDPPVPRPIPTEYVTPEGARMVLAFDRASTEAEIAAAWVPATPEDAAKLPRRVYDELSTAAYAPVSDRPLSRPYLGPNFAGDDEAEAVLREKAGVASPYGRRLRDRGVADADLSHEEAARLSPAYAARFPDVGGVA